ncbi:MAG: response regulator transcription factor [Nitrospirae bacterium]|nr:response regulator transcription factor [Nitrospirota bacterium]
MVPRKTALYFESSDFAKPLIHLAIIEGDRFLLENLKFLLECEPGVSVVGAYSSSEEAMDSLKKASPDIVMMDIGFSGVPVVGIIENVKAIIPEVKIIIHTLFDDRRTVFSAFKAGVSGYILKGSPLRGLAESIGVVFHGGAALSPRITRTLIGEFQTRNIGDPLLLSRREKEILRGIEGGLSYKDLSQRLFISHHTVHSHMKKIYQKLQVGKRKEAIIEARKRGIL